MERIKKIIEEEIILITFGKPKSKNLDYSKVKINPVLIKDTSLYQMEYIKDNKAFHENIKKEELYNKITEKLQVFKNMNIFTSTQDYSVYSNKDYSISIIKNKATKKVEQNQSHNKKKKYLINESDHPQFLVDLGIMDEHFKVKQNSYSKFRQINRFLEIVNDDIEKISGKVQVVDFCCGKGYLTLAIWYYLKNIKKFDSCITGIDLKSDVIELLNKFHYEDLQFLDMDINDYQGGNIDIAIGLHACDIATDISIYNAVKNNAKLIYMVPCCQHELFKMMDNELLQPMLKYGILKDKMTELMTNTLRGLALEAVGYEVKMIEFTSLDHTMKNVMIKAVYTGAKNNEAMKQYKALENEFHVKCSIDQLFNIDNIFSS